MILAEHPQSATSILETLKDANVACFIARFCRRGKGTDIRCFVIGDKVVATMQRIGQDGEFVQIFIVVALQKKLNSLKRKIHRHSCN